MNRTSKIATFALAIVAALFVASLGQYIGRSTVDYGYETYKEATVNQSIEKQLEEAAQKLNKRLPDTRAINQQIEMDSVVAGPGKQLSFLYTVHQVDHFTEEQLAKLFVATRDRLCSSNLRRLLDSGATFNYKYRDKDARWVKDVTVRSQDCGS